MSGVRSSARRQVRIWSRPLPGDNRRVSVVVVAVLGSRVEAEMITGMLRSHGVKASVSGDDMAGLEVALQAQGVPVLVPDVKVAEARRPLAGSGSGRSEAGELSAFQRWIVRLLGGDKPRP